MPSLRPEITRGQALTVKAILLLPAAATGDAAAAAVTLRWREVGAAWGAAVPMTARRSGTGGGVYAAGPVLSQ